MGMTLINKLIAKEFQDEIKKSIREDGRSPMFTVLGYKDKSAKLYRWNEIVPKTEPPSEICATIVQLNVGQNMEKEYIHWLSGFIDGINAVFKNQKRVQKPDGPLFLSSFFMVWAFRTYFSAFSNKINIVV